MFGKRDRQQLLGQVPLFSACSDKELDALAKHAELVDFRAGQTLMVEGQDGHEFFVIVDGAGVGKCRQRAIDAGEADRGARVAQPGVDVLRGQERAVASEGRENCSLGAGHGSAPTTP